MTSGKGLDMNENMVARLREKIDSIDGRISKLLEKRLEFSGRIQDAKPSPVKFSARREKKILDRFPGEIKNVFLAILQVCRKCDDSVKWFRIAAESESGDMALTILFHRIFGEKICSAIASFEEAACVSRSFDERAMIPCVVISEGKAGPKGKTKKFFHKYAGFRSKGKTVFSVYSNIPCAEGPSDITL